MKISKTIIATVENGWILSKFTKIWDGTNEETMLFPLLKNNLSHEVFERLLNTAFGDKFKISVKPIDTDDKVNSSKIKIAL